MSYRDSADDDIDEYDLEQELEKELAALGPISEDEIKAAQQNYTCSYHYGLEEFPPDEDKGAERKGTSENATGKSFVFFYQRNREHSVIPNHPSHKFLQ
jgi:hypothetical protein